jgi:hypothetical protein
MVPNGKRSVARIVPGCPKTPMTMQASSSPGWVGLHTTRTALLVRRGCSRLGSGAPLSRKRRSASDWAIRRTQEVDDGVAGWRARSK